MATNQRDVNAEIGRLYPIDNHFCPKDGSAMEHLEHRHEYICLLCGETQKEEATP